MLPHALHSVPLMPLALHLPNSPLPSPAPHHAHTCLITFTSPSHLGLYLLTSFPIGSDPLYSYYLDIGMEIHIILFLFPVIHADKVCNSASVLVTAVQLGLLFMITSADLKHNSSNDDQIYGQPPEHVGLNFIGLR